MDKKKVSNIRDFSQRPVNCVTIVEFAVEGDYPFIPSLIQGGVLSPHIDYDVRFVFTVVGSDRVSVSVSGIHDAFPSYDSVVDGTCLYCNYTTFSGPSYVSLGWLATLLFPATTMVISAETPKCCSD